MQELLDIIKELNLKKDGGRLLVISGPSAVGKGTMVRRIMEEMDNVRLSVSATTRRPRSGEEHGIHYYFMSDDEFEKTVNEGGFLEYAFVHGHYYGTPRRAVEEQLAQGNDVILEIDVQGAMQVKKTGSQAVYIFVLPPSMDELRHRFALRGTESPEDVELRMNKAAEEMRYLERYDYYIVNDDLERAIADLRAIIVSEHHRVKG